jgi:hypothetical protein
MSSAVIRAAAAWTQRFVTSDTVKGSLLFMSLCIPHVNSHVFPNSVELPVVFAVAHVGTSPWLMEFD